MRKDVTLGLAVGGLLVLVIVTYAIFFTGGHKDRTKDLAAKNNPPDTSQSIVPSGRSSAHSDSGSGATGSGAAGSNSTSGEPIVAIAGSSTPSASGSALETPSPEIGRAHV